MTYRVFHLSCTPELSEILTAFLADAGFDSFAETEDGLDAYATDAQIATWLNVLHELNGQFDFTYRSEVLPDKNWNEVWERQFQPIRIGDRLLIRASFHPADATVAQELVIDPKMAFGTGHHATTYMMCEQVMDFFARRDAGKSVRVLDYGSGTGVLAILAKRLGAAEVDAVDIEAPAYESTLENAGSNGVQLDEVVHGELSDVPDGNPYDLVVANINRNVLLETGEALYHRLGAGGTALMSGVLEQDERMLVGHMQGVGFRHRATFARGDWRAFDFTRD